MTNRYHSLGDPNVGYFELWDQTGGNTPAHLRKVGRFTDNPFFKRRVTIVNPLIGDMKSDAGVVLPGSNVPVRRIINPSWSFGSPKPMATTISKMAGEWRNTDLSLGLVLSPEGKESVSMMAGSLARLYGSVRELRRGNVTGFVRNLGHLPQGDRKRVKESFNQGDLSGSFLAAHLGWSPLINDVYAAANIEPPPQRSQSLSVKDGYLGAFVDLKSMQDKGFKAVGGAFGLNTLKVRIVKTPTFQQRFGLDNPFLIAWNLVPLSFVADYFLPIGDTIDALGFVASNSVDRTLLCSYRSLRIECTVPKRAYVAYKWDVPYYNQHDVTFIHKETIAQRQKYALTLGACLDWKMSLPQSWQRLSTLVALTHQSLLSLPGRR